MTMLSWRVSDGWEVFASYSLLCENKPSLKFAFDIIKRDGCRCNDCGFTSRLSKKVPTGYMTVHPIEGDYLNRDIDRWHTLCPFCSSAKNVISAMTTGDYKVVAAPWISQHELFNVVRPLLCILSDPDHLYYAEALQSYKRIEASENSLATLIPNIPDTEKTASLNIRKYFLLMDSVLTDEQYQQRSYIVDGLRLLPTKSYSSDEIDYWNQAVYKNYPLSKWERLINWKKEQK